MSKAAFLVVWGFLVVMHADSFAWQNKFGAYIGGNYFFKYQEPKFVVYLEGTGQGKIILDDDGFSAQVGLVYSFLSSARLNLEYQTNRSCAYSYPATSTPLVYGPNTYWVKSRVSGFSLGLQYFPVQKSRFGACVGGKFNYTRVEGHIRYGFINSHNEILYFHPKTGYFEMGHMMVPGYSLSVGLETKISRSFSLLLSAEKYWGNIDAWMGGMRDVTVDHQRLDGFCCLINLVCWLKKGGVK
jgi:hypothetical protein